MTLLLDSNSIAINAASERGTLKLRECFNTRLQVAYWTLEDENGVIETFLVKDEAVTRAMQCSVTESLSMECCQ